MYEQTEWGAELEPVFAALAQWGVRSPVVPLAGELTDDAVMLGVRTFFDRGDAPPWTATYQVRLERDSYLLKVVRGRLAELVREQARGPVDTTVVTDRNTMRALLVRADTVDTTLATGRLSITGDTDAVLRLLDAAGISSAR